MELYSEKPEKEAPKAAAEEDSQNLLEKKD